MMVQDDEREVRRVRSERVKVWMEEMMTWKGADALGDDDCRPF